MSKSQARRENAYDAAQRKKRLLHLVEYVVEEDDIIILSGVFTGRSVRELFSVGPNERDYIVKNLWYRNDEQVRKILRELAF